MIVYFPLQKVFNHSSMLQCSVIFHYYSVSHFTLLQHTGSLSHFAKLLSSIVGGRRLTARSRACGTEPRVCGRLVWSCWLDRTAAGWSKWWIAVPYIYIYIYIYIHTHTYAHILFITLGDRPMGPSLGLASQPTSPANPMRNGLPAHYWSRAPRFVPRALCWPTRPALTSHPRSKPHLDRANTCQPSWPTPRTLDPCDSAIFYLHSVILLKCLPFYGFAQSFCYSELSHYAIVNSAILL
jgi:hypothetical protein